MAKPKISTKSLYFLIFILTVGLFLYHNVRYMNIVNYGFTLKNYLENPEKYGNRSVESFGKIINISQDHFYFSLGDTYIKVFGSGIKKPIYGETVVFLDLREDGRIELIDYHNYNYNYLLYIFSVFALVVFVIMLFKDWKITLRGFKDKDA